ncbi:MAG: hypothetical protein PUI09_06260 [bacterium]|nr:hypothetical protein [bacterium]MDY2650606.1 hypothetical protein [Candidatus Egerieousia sp.]
MANDASSGVGNSSAQTVDAHVPREWEGPASEALREGWSEAQVCAEEVAAPREPMWHIGKQLHSAKQGAIGTSNLPNQQHREEHFLANNGAKWAGAEGVRGSNLACFLKNFVSNYIVIFLMMLFRVHL